MWLTTSVFALASFLTSEAAIEVFRHGSNQSEFRVEEKLVIAPYNVPPDEGTIGRLVAATYPFDGCTKVPDIPHNKSRNHAWFLLARRYGCTFFVKMKNAQEKGYSGIIIYDTDDNQMFGHSFGSVDLTLYSVLISNRDGLILDACTYDKGYYILWLPSANFNLLTYLIPCIMLILLCVLMIACLVVAQHCTRWYRERRRNAKYRLAKKYLRQLPVKKWTKGSPEFERYETCSICLDEYQEGDKLRILPCLHAYHANRCIDPWLTKNRRVCPLCKRKIVLPGMPEDSSDDETAPLLSTSHDTEGGTFQHQATRSTQIEVEVDVNPQSDAASSSLYVPGGHYSVNDEVEVLPRRKPRKKKKSSRRRQEVLDDVSVAGPSTSSNGLQVENQLVSVTEMGSDDEQPLIS